MSAERRSHSRSGAPFSGKAGASNSNCTTAPSIASSAARAPRGPAAHRHQPASPSRRAAAARRVRAGGGRGTGRLWTRGLTEQDALGFLGDRGVGVDRPGLLVGALRRRPLADRLEPALEVRKILEPLSLRLVRYGPGVTGNVRDRILTGEKVTPAEALVEHAVEAVGLLDVALDGVGDLLGRVAREVVVLAGHRTQARDLPEQPLQCLETATQCGRQQPAALLGEVEEDGAGLEHRKRRTAAGRVVIDDRGDAVI